MKQEQYLDISAAAIELYDLATVLSTLEDLEGVDEDLKRKILAGGDTDLKDKIRALFNDYITLRDLFKRFKNND